MGKDKSAQRTKGNQKPSSSGRSAELLGGAKGFIGFGGLSDICYVPAASQGTAEDDFQISSEFRVALRKMSKKDTVTKIKALQEFEALCHTETLEALKTTLPFWPRLYGRLSLDNERRVREAAQSAHNSLVTKVGKHLAPHLRLIMPVWLLAMTDPHIPVSLTANKAFINAFAEDKRAGVMLFCSKEIMDYIIDNLTVQTPQTLSDPKTTAIEDVEGKYSRVVSCSLKGLGIFLEWVKKLPEKKGDVDPKVSLLFDSEKFWKHSKFKAPCVRSAWYNCIKSLFEYDANFLKPYCELLCKHIFPSLDEADASVLPHIWISFLHLCVDLPDCWNFCDKPQSLFGRIFSVLRDGGRGCASDLCPQLLPILGVIPDRALADKNAFTVDFFKAISTSLRKDQILINKREVSAIVVALFECLKYKSIQDGNNADVWDTLIKYQVVDLVVSSITELPLLPKSLLFSEVGKLIFFWSTKATHEKNQINVDFSSKFWELFLLECEKWLSTGNQTKLNGLEFFFKAIQNPFVEINKPNQVTFSDTKNLPSPVVTRSCTETKSLDSFNETSKVKYIGDISTQVHKFVINCFEVYKTKGHSSCYRLFACLVSSFSSDSTLGLLLEDSSGVDSPELAKIHFFEDILMPLMEDPKVPSDSSVDMFMYLYVQLKDTQKKNILINLRPSLSLGCLRLLVERLSNLRQEDETVAFWLKSPHLGCRLVRTTQQLCAISATQTPQMCQTLESYLESSFLLKFVVSAHSEEGHIFSSEYLSQMIKVMQSALEQQISSYFQSGESALSENALFPCLIDILESCLKNPFCWDISGLSDLFSTLFTILCDIEGIQSLPIYKRLTSLLTKSFEHYLAHSPLRTKSECIFMEGYLSSIIHKVKALIMEEETSYRKVAYLIDLSEKLLILIKDHTVPENYDLILDHSFIQAAMNVLIPTESEWSTLEMSLSPTYVCPPILFGWMYSRDFPLSRSFTPMPPWNQKYIRTCLFFLELLNRLCASSSTVVKGLMDGPEQEKEAVSLGQYTRLAAFCLHATCHATVMKQLNSQLICNLISEDVEFGVKSLDSQMQMLLDKINIGNKKHIVKIIRDRCMDGSSLWCTTLRVILMKWIKLSSEAFTIVIELDDDSLGVTATKQTLLRYMSEDHRCNVLEEEAAKLSSLCDDPFSAVPSVVLITSALDNLPSEFSRNVIEVVFKCFTRWRDIADHIFLFATDLKCAPWEEVSLLVNIIHLIAVIVRCHSSHLTASNWDFILCSLSAWVQSLQEAVKSMSNDTVVAMFICATSRCVHHVSKVMMMRPTTPIEGDAENEPGPLATLQEEWKEFFAPPINDILLKNFLLCNELYAKEPSVVLFEISYSLSLALQPLEDKQIQEINLPALFRAEEEDAPLKLPDKLQTLMNHLSPLLLCRHTASQASTFNHISLCLPSLIQAWDKNDVPLNEEEDLPQRSLPYNIISIMTQSETSVDAYLSDRDVGMGCEVLPHTDAYSHCLGYLLSWMLSLASITHASELTQSLYCSFLRESGHLHKLLEHLLKLLPVSPTFSASSGYKKGANMINTKVNLSPEYSPSSDTVSWVACQVYVGCLTQLPAAVRSWWNNTDRVTQQIMDKFTSTFVSPILIQNELGTINDSNVKFDNMKVKARLGAREVIATYTIDEASMELVLRLAPNHPLSIVTLEDHKRVGVSLAEWRNWLFGLNTLLSHRNTPLLNSLEFWKRNVDQKFEGIEECFICYYVLHGANHQIPKLLCRTCKKKFHPSCLYKWFNTSNKSTCPICRSLF